eukprot:TRINITY_DN4302_c0_g2_i1.p1 TRINITY_DN4302_c0_g2~~TRINITY_DN4302_c0_g2_i1.p1  ORF type:complete len:106 (+),score=36.16 TRINITY_DN4302_c0_g2_i1:135-452(+)
MLRLVARGPQRAPTFTMQLRAFTQEVETNLTEEEKKKQQANNSSGDGGSIDVGVTPSDSAPSDSAPSDPEEKTTFWSILKDLFSGDGGDGGGDCGGGDGGGGGGD